MSEIKPKVIFEYDNYRELLKDLYAQNKLKNKIFSYRYFSKQAGFAAPNFLKLVMEGKSNLSAVSIEKFIKGFKFSKEEGQFFRHLVLLNQATTSEEKVSHAQEILKLKGYRKIRPLSEAQFNFFSKWYFIPIWESVRLKGFKESPEWIAKVIKGEVTTDQVKEALRELQKLGLLTRDKEGHLEQITQNVATPDEVSSIYLTVWHKEMIKRASDSIDTVARNKRDISSVTLGVPKGSEAKLKEIIQKFRRDVLEIVSGQEKYESVYQLNLQLFPLAEVIDESS